MSNNCTDCTDDTNQYYVGCPCCCPLNVTEFALPRCKWESMSASLLVKFTGKWDAVLAAQKLNGMLNGLSDAQMAQLSIAVRDRKYFYGDGYGIEGREALKCVPKKTVDALLKKKLNNKAAKSKEAERRRIPSPSNWCVDAAAQIVTDTVYGLSNEQQDQLVAALAAIPEAKNRFILQGLVFPRDRENVITAAAHIVSPLAKWFSAAGLVAATCGVVRFMVKKI